MAVLEGRVLWGRFAFWIGLPVLLMCASPAFAAWSLHANFRGQFIAAGFALLIGSYSLLRVAVSLATVVTWFQLGGDRLTYRRLFRLQRSARLADVAFLEGIAEGRNGVTVWLQGGQTLYVSPYFLSNSLELAEMLTASLRRDPDRLEGRLVRSAVVMRLVGHGLITCLLTVIALFGWMILAVTFHPARVPNQGVFLPLGCLILSLCAAGFYYFVISDWKGCIRWFRLDQNTLSFRTVLSRSVEQRLVTDVVAMSTHRPDTPAAEAGSWKEVRFADGKRIRLQKGILLNAEELFSRLKQETDKRKAEMSASLRPINIGHAYQARLEEVLESDEVVYWIGRPVYRKLASEMAAVAVAGTLLALVGAGGLAFFVLVGLAGNPGPLFVAAVPLMFLGGGIWTLGFPWRCRRWFDDALYVVTSRRVIVLNGFQWGYRSGVSRRDEPCRTFGPAEIRNYELVNRGRDISLGGEWHRGRRCRQYWTYVGLLAPDDAAAAEAAIPRLLEQLGEDINNGSTEFQQPMESELA